MLPLILNGKKFVNFGDSRVAGYLLADPAAQRWTRLVADAAGGIEENYASTGSTLEIQPSNGNVLNFNLLPTYNAATHAYLHLTIGSNDIRGGEYTVAGGKARLISWMNAAVAKGWPTSRIILTNVYYFRSFGDGGSPEKLAAYNAMFREVAVQFNTPFVDFYTPTAANPNRESLLPDGLHENLAGQQFIRDIFLAADFTPLGNISTTPPALTGVRLRFRLPIPS